MNDGEYQSKTREIAANLANMILATRVEVKTQQSHLLITIKNETVKVALNGSVMQRSKVTSFR